MKLATLKNGTRDGQLIIVSKDLSTAVSAAAVAPTMLYAVENWTNCISELTNIYNALNLGKLENTFTFDPYQAMAPLPRSFHFIDGSAFLNHGDIMVEAFNLDIENDPSIPILIQRQGDDFRGPHENYEFPNEEDGADFEGEFAVILDDVPLGVNADSALDHVKLITIFNDMSMRSHLFREMKMGFGFIQAKPATVFAAVAVTPDELGDDWCDGRIHLNMEVSRNNEWFGHPNGREMDLDFTKLISHLAYNRNLCAGTIIGSGTVSNKNYKETGSACLAEKRAIEVIAHGEPKTPFLSFGETLQFDVKGADGQSVFGKIDHKLVKS